MSGESIPMAEFDHFTSAAKATEKRLLAENTWLRHHFDDLECRVQGLKKEIAALKAAATQIGKSLGLAPIKEPKTRKSK